MNKHFKINFLESFFSINWSLQIAHKVYELELKLHKYQNLNKFLNATKFS